MTGTLGRYFKANVRYGLFCIYPILLLLGFVIFAVLLAGVAAALLGVPSAPVTAPLIAVAVFALLMRLVAIHLDFALADWCFAADLVRDTAPGLDESSIGSPITSSSASGPDADEVVLSGVSLGAVMMAEAIDRAGREPDRLWFRRGRS